MDKIYYWKFKKKKIIITLTFHKAGTSDFKL